MEQETRNQEDRTMQEEAMSRPSYFPADQTPRREGGDDSLAEADPTDPRNDERVIVNKPERKNNPSMPDANSSIGATSTKSERQ